MKLSEMTRRVGVNDNTTQLFENQWTLPQGVSYNSYLVIGEKIALVDTVSGEFSQQYIENIKAEIGERPIDFLIVNHVEPDHSGLIGLIRTLYPEVTVVTNAKAVAMISGFQGVTDNVKVIKEGESLDLGGATLKFFMAPMVHWPETMVTYLVEEKILFSGDAFGCFGEVKESAIDGFEAYQEEMIRYYASIVGKYGVPVQAALKKLSGLDIDLICSTHGPVWKDDKSKVIAQYDMLSRYEGIRGTAIVADSMYGNTMQAAKTLEEDLKRKNIPCVLCDLSSDNMSFAYAAAFKYDSIAVGSPTYNGDILPTINDFMHGIKLRMLKNRRFVAFGSYSWAPASVKILNGMADELGFTRHPDGISFPHAYSAEKCDMGLLADWLENNA